MSKDDDYDDYSDDFVSDDEDAKGRRSKNKYRSRRKSSVRTADLSPLKPYGGRRESEDFWSSSHTETYNPPSEDSPVQSDANSQASSLDDLAPPTRQPSGVSNSHSVRMQSAKPRRVNLTRGLTQTISPGWSLSMSKLSEETGETKADFKPKKTAWNPAKPKTGPTKPTHGKNKSYAKPKGRGRGRGGMSSQKQSPRIDNVAQRMLSASRIKMNELRNQLEDHNTVMRDLREENKLLKKMQYRQERALGKFEDQESDLPRLILKHNNEVRTLKEQLKTSKEKFERTDRYLRDAEDDLERANSKLKKYKKLAENKNLPERDELNRKLSKAEMEIEDKDSKIKELQRHIDHLSKNHRHELGVEIARHRETRRQMEEMKEDRENLENKLKEKEKELDIKNIYSNRVMRPPHKLPASYGGTPLDTPPPGNPHRRVPSIPEMTAREKAKMFELKRREEMKKNKPKPKPRQEMPKDAFTDNQESLEEERNRLFLEEKERREQENRYLKAQEEEERAREREREREREWERERERQREEDDLRRERDRIKRESQELDSRRRNQREREDRERREREEQERIEREERERREQYERERELERKAQEAREQLENDPRAQEERRKKDMLLARLKAIDDGSKENVSPLNRSPFDDDSSSPSSKKSYSFSKPVENLHNGKPAYEEVSVPYIDRLKQQRARDDDVAGYNPSFGGRSSGNSSMKGGYGETSSPSRKPNRQTALMDELFGGQTGTTKKDDDTLFLNSDTKKKSSKRTSGFPWEDSSTDQNSGNGSRHRENSSTLFGGGAALIEDDSTSDKSKLLPRRSRHLTSTFSSKPAVTAVDFEDDIEEVVL